MNEYNEYTEFGTKVDEWIENEPVKLKADMIFDKYQIYQWKADVWNYYLALRKEFSTEEEFLKEEAENWRRIQDYATYHWCEIL